MPEADYGVATRWLTCLTIESEVFGETPSGIIKALELENIEARPVWKPMHLQPVFSGCRVRGGRVASGIFETGICLPSGSSLTAEQRQRVIEIVRDTART